jgi:hypothetical protein
MVGLQDHYSRFVSGDYWQFPLAAAWVHTRDPNLVQRYALREWGRPVEDRKPMRSPRLTSAWHAYPSLEDAEQALIGVYLAGKIALAETRRRGTAASTIHPC